MAQQPPLKPESQEDVNSQPPPAKPSGNAVWEQSRTDLPCPKSGSGKPPQGW